MTRASNLLPATLLPTIALCFSAAAPAADTPEEAVELRARFERFTSTSGHRMPSDVTAPLPGTEGYRALPRRPASGIDPESLEAMDAYLAERSSAAILVWHEGQVVWEHYFGDRDEDTLFDAMSLAKPLSVIAVGRAIAEGYIGSLDQPASDFITEWRGTPKGGILVRHLLDMRAGFKPQDFNFGGDENHPNARAYLHPKHESVIVNEYPLVNEPGTRYEYSGPTSALVAVLIERATGVPYERWLSEQVLAPLGARGGRIYLNRPDGMPHSGCCTLLPAESFLRVAVLLLNGGQWGGVSLLPEGFVQAMRTPTPENLHAGMGVYVAGDYVEWRGPLNPDATAGRIRHGEPYLADDLFLFDGNQRQVAYIVPSADLVILRLGDWPPRDVEWDHSVVPNTILSAMDFAPGERPVPQRRTGDLIE
jgi:CubicO group peptidase (beta-lactamase class C family)